MKWITHSKAYLLPGPLNRRWTRWDLMFFCSQHFERRMFTGERTKLLVADAVPTLFNVPLKRPSDCQRKEREEGVPSFGEFINKFELKCRECGEVLNADSPIHAQNVMVAHVRVVHFMDATSYMLKHHLGELATTELHFQCPLCSPSDITTWTKKTLVQHAEQQHLITPKELYERAFGVDELEKVLCDVVVKVDPLEPLKDEQAQRKREIVEGRNISVKRCRLSEDAMADEDGEVNGVINVKKEPVEQEKIGPHLVELKVEDSNGPLEFAGVKIESVDFEEESLPCEQHGSILGF